MGWRLGIDIGGTFTDFVLQKDDSSPLVVEKALSTPDDRSRAVFEGIERLAASEGITVRALLERLDALVHATTVGDNTLIEMSGAVTGLLTTNGFRDELELRRGFKEDIWDVRLEPPTPIVPRRRRLGVPERVLFDGSIREALDEDAAREAIARLAAQGVESIAIATLFSFVNPVHEERLAELVRELLPTIPVSLSHRVMPKAPEFERTSTTVVNAYIGPRVSGYLELLGARLRESGLASDLLVMQSSGGVMTRRYLTEAPVRVLASGPAAGVIGSARFGRAKREPDLLCVDMGGTSYDVSVVRKGTAPAQPGWNWHHRYVLGLPMVSVETLGAGGGSLCHVAGGRLAVGPASAGADPGPVCYGRGGKRPTVTDANLVLGLLSEDADFAGGRFQLTRDGVDDAFREHVAGPLDCSVEEAAFDCWRVVNANMTQAVRRSTADKGTDPRDLAMLAYGGNGPVFAGVQAEELGIERVWVPRTSPAFSALGTLAARPGLDEERSLLAPLAEAPVDRVRELWSELTDRALEFLGEAGQDPAEIRFRFQANVRYPGQNWSLAVDAEQATGKPALDFVTDGLRAELVSRFHALHRDEYGHDRPTEPPELTGVRLRAWASVPSPPLHSGHTAPRRAAAASTHRNANLGRGFARTPVHRGIDLAPGHTVGGPAIIEERFTTIVVYPDWEATVDDAGDYQMRHG